MSEHDSYFREKPKTNSENLFDRLKRSISEASQSKEDKRPALQATNSISIWFPNANSLRSSSSHDVNGKDTTQPKEVFRMADTYTEPFPVDESAIPVLKKVYSTQDDEPVIALFEDPVAPSYWSYNSQKTPICRKKTKPLNGIALATINGRKRASPACQQRPHKENKEALDPAVEAKTNPFPVKSFYSGSIQINAVTCSKSPVEDEKSSSIPKLVNLDQSQDELDPPYSQSGPSVTTRSRSFSSQYYQPYEIGLKNFGNTCYVNATLQVLLALPGFMDDLIGAFENVENLPFFANLFAKIVAARKAGFLNAVNTSTRNFVDGLWMLHPSYSVGEQQDANEFLVRLIEFFKSALPAGPANPVESHFQCEMVEEYHCAKCGKKRKNVQKNTSICLPFSNSSSDLEQCLQTYMAEEERDLPCNSCHATTMKTSSKFRSLPSKLIMSVNRFSRDAKLAKHIVPPTVLDVRRFMENPDDALPSEYALVAQIVHEGKSKHFGHYVSHVHCEDSEWRFYSDTFIKTVCFTDEIQSVNGDPAYVYFYIHQSPIK